MLEKIPFDLTIDFPTNTWLNDNAQLREVETNWILYKTIPGIGATFGEIIAKRNSIIMLPHVSIIKNKQIKHKDKHHTFAIHGDDRDTKPKDIDAYLTSDVPFKKFLTTPQGLTKIKWAVERLAKRGIKIDLFKEYFLLIDEGHKWVKDVDYREDMVPPMDDFFEFDNKGIVSATMLPFSDPRFAQQGFKRIKINPVYPTGEVNWFKSEPFKRNVGKIKSQNLKPKHPYKKDILLHSVNSITTGLMDYINANPAPANCIFFNSIQGIMSIIKDLGIEAESRVFCSKESAFLLRIKERKLNISHEFLPEDSRRLAKYNFFTSSFYTGLDIDLCIKPNIIILTDCQTIKYSIVDPYTDVIQIIGRFRKEMYQSVVHINNYTKFIEQPSQKDLETRMANSKIVYESIENLKVIATDSELQKVFEEVMEWSYPYSTLFSSGQYSYFKEDNYWNLKRIRSYYKQPYLISSAYRNSNLYNVYVDRAIYEGSEVIKLKRSSGKYTRENVIEFAVLFDELDLIKGTLNYYPKADELGQYFPVLAEAYERMGLPCFFDADFKIKRIRQSIILLDKEKGYNSLPLIDLVHDCFRVGGRYSRDSVKKKLQKLYKLIGLDVTAKATDLERYFELKITNIGTKDIPVSGFKILDLKVNMKTKYLRP